MNDGGWNETMDEKEFTKTELNHDLDDDDENYDNINAKKVSVLHAF